LKAQLSLYRELLRKEKRTVVESKNDQNLKKEKRTVVESKSDQNNSRLSFHLTFLSSFFSSCVISYDSPNLLAW